MEKDNNIMHGSGEKGEWKTINGAHVFVEDGQTIDEAMNQQFKKTNTFKSTADSINQDKERDDKYTNGNSDNINKATTINEIEKDIAGYKGSGSIDLVLPGGRWIQVRPQNDGTYLIRTSNGQKYVSSVEDIKDHLNKTFNSQSKRNNFESKQELIDFIKHQTNVELKDDKSERFNNDTNILYARIPGKTGFENQETNPVLALLNKNGIRHEEHLNGGYWIFLKNK